MRLLNETIEQIEASEAGVRAAFSGDGSRLGGGGSHRRLGLNESEYIVKLAETARFVEEVTRGRRPMYHLAEAMTTSDFPVLFGDILDRQLLANYREVPATWRAVARPGTVPDFRAVKRFALDGAEGQLDPVDEREEYPEVALAETSDQYGVRKYGRRIDLSWEALINDDLDAFRTAPERLARGARRSEQKFVSQLYVGAAGPHASLYNGTFGNLVNGQPALSIQSLQQAYTQLASLVDVDGEPIALDMVTLVIPPALKVIANNILNATDVFVGGWAAGPGSGAQGTQLRTSNWMANETRLVIDPYIPQIATSNGNTSWWLFADPASGRAAIEFGKLRGYEEPALYERVPNARQIGGGEVMESFEDDSRAWKVRHVYGGARLTNTGGWRSTIASNGTGPGS